MGIEFGSTRIKAVLIDQENKPIAQGSHTWETTLVDGLSTCGVLEDEIVAGVRDSMLIFAQTGKSQYGIEMRKLAAMSYRAMMHGYMAFNDKEKMSVPFRTWRNTNTGKALPNCLNSLSRTFREMEYTHLYQAILNKEEHVKDITFLLPLAGY